MTDCRVRILGAGGFGREVYGYLGDRIAQGDKLEIEGFLDDRPDALAGLPLSVPVLGSLDDTEADDDVWYIIAFGDAELRARWGVRLFSAGCQLCTLIHPTAYVSSSATIGPGSIICPFAAVCANATIEINSVLNCYASAGHDAIVGAHSILSPYSTLNGFARLGTRVFMGSHSAVLPGLSVGAGTKISAGSVVNSDVQPGSLAHGNPARQRILFPVQHDE